jgi:hypothetical protein
MSAPVASETRSPFSAGGDQRVLGRRAEPGGDQQGAELVTVQGDGMGLMIHSRPPDMGGRGVLEEFLFDGILADPAMVHSAG